MAWEQLSQEYRNRLTELLGEPVMVDDPLITTAQAAALLGLSPRRVARLVRAGHLPARARSHRRILLSDVVRSGLDQWISVAEAAEIHWLGEREVRRLISVELLAAHGRELPLRRGDVEALAQIRESWLSIPDAAALLGVRVGQVEHMLRSRALTHTGDDTRPVRRREIDQLAARPAQPAQPARPARPARSVSVAARSAGAANG
ncbi:hypothetical protein GCM10009789_36680 [Kribbella sancticallisti]|uniref:Helix-turn-helix domain-containing protein n=1 Tax=Kribbella sancticallisti TaxID=460087 RepID=A0ABP4PF66_9ACTN